MTTGRAKADNSKALNGRKPLVSVVAIAYNHEKYIKQAIESMLMQKTNFDFEIVIGDDGSTDSTAAIIKEYEKKHPKIIKPILSKKNYGLQQNFIKSLNAARGKYIALCECDDYWTDSNKLQAQADFLEKNPDYMINFHPVEVFYENNKRKKYIYPEESNPSVFTLDKLIDENFIQTNSVMYRAITYENIPDDVLPIDLYLHLMHAKLGKIGFINKPLAAYRRHSEGVWWEGKNDKNGLWKRFGLQRLSLYVELLSLFRGDRKRENKIRARLFDIVDKLIEVDNTHDTKILFRATYLYPEVIAKYTFENEISKQLLERKYKELVTSNNQILEKYEVAINDLKAIKRSRVWRLRNRIAPLINKKIM